MAFDGRSLYELADKLYKDLDSSGCNDGDQNNEAECRTIVNRAYYGAFLVARNKAKIESTGKGAHKDVQIYYGRRDKTGVRISNRLNSLFTHRTDADYKTDLTTGRRDAQKSLRLAQEIINDLKLAPKS